MKKHSACVPLSLLLAAGLAVPAYAQDATTDAAPAADSSATPPDAGVDAAADAGAADAAAPAEAGTADASASDSTAADSSADAGSVDASTDTAAADGGDSGKTGSASHEPFYLYGGVDYAFLRTSLSKESLKDALGGDDFDSNFYRLRIGTRLLPSIGVEAQFGVKGDDGKDPGKVETNQMYGVYIVPTGNLFRFLEVSAPVGYSHLRLENDNGKVKFDSLSFGLNIEFPIYVNPQSRLPDVRIGGGGVVYYAEREARTYGYHAGVRLDFKI